MPWTDHAGPTPERSQEELLTLVQARARKLRRRRVRTSASMGALAVMAVVVLAIAAIDRTPDRTSLRVTGPPPPSSGIADATASVETSTTVPPPAPASTLAPASSTVPTVSPTTSLRPAPTAPVGSGAATTAAAASTTTTSTTLRPLVACTPGEVVVTVATDRTTYAPGETVRITAAAQNRSDHACHPVDPRFEFSQEPGTPLGGVAVADMFTMGRPGEPPPRWEPGQTLTAPLEWAPTCPPSHSARSCPPGVYTVVASFGSSRSAPARFSIT